MAVADEMVWMRHDESGGVAQLPAAAREAWEAKGWAECEAPAEPDPALVEHVPMAVARAQQAEAEAAQSTSDTEEPTTDRSEEEGVSRGRRTR